MGGIGEKGNQQHPLAYGRMAMQLPHDLLESVGSLMTTRSINRQLELVRDCYGKVAAAHKGWGEYRRAAGEGGVATPDLPQFLSIMTALTHTAEELDRKREAAVNALCGVGVLQVEVCSEDGKRKVVASRPTERSPEPYISRAAHHALVQMLGEGLRTTAPFDIAVVDDFGKVCDKRIKTTQWQQKGNQK